jgi:uncharacterized protein DUF1800
MVDWNEENAAHLLRRAGFGGDSRDIDRTVRFGQTLAVERLIGVAGSPAKGPGRSDNNAEDFDTLQRWWAKRMVKASARRLQEKMVLFWHDHFASSFDVVKNNLWMAQQNRLFRLYGLGSFRTLVIEVTRDPAMLEFLDGKQSTKTKPNENYGRELMELFVLGVSDMNGDDNYTQTDVEQLTRALTGFQIMDDAGVFVPARFDTGTKTLFEGQAIASGNLGVVDASGTPLPPATNAIDVLFQHRDSDGELTMPRFIAKKLWEYFAYPFAASSMTLAQRSRPPSSRSSATSSSRRRARVPPATTSPRSRTRCRSPRARRTPTSWAWRPPTAWRWPPGSSAWIPGTRATASSSTSSAGRSPPTRACRCCSA